MQYRIAMPINAKRRLNIIALAMLFFGFFGFLGFFVAAVGASKLLPADFEWPPAVSTGVVELDGVYYVPHPASRVQAYDEDWNFITSWYVPSNGGPFAIIRGVRSTITVYSARRKLALRYSPSGQLISQKTSDYYPQSGETLVVPTPYYLWIFSHPFGFWLIGLLGILLHILLEKNRR